MVTAIDCKSKIWIVTGPTASGKSSLALEMAEHFNGEILNADSIQTYRDLRILTARPSVEDEQRVPHHGYGMLDSFENFSSGAWRRWVHTQINRLQNEDKTIIIVGGTGLYLKAITQPFVDLPEIDPAVKSGIIANITHHGLEKYYDKLKHIDPSTAQRISPYDPQRIIRALEVFIATGKPLSIWQIEGCVQPQYEFTVVLMQPDKSNLYYKAEARVEEMFINGAIDEIKALIDHAIPSTAPIFRALGAQQLWHYLHHQLTLNEAMLLTKQATRQYIKRQYTWFRHQLTADYILNNDQSVQQFITGVVSSI